MARRAIRAAFLQWAFVIWVRVLMTSPRVSPRGKAVGIGPLVLTCIAAHGCWLLTGRGPWRWMGGTAPAFHAGIRGLPDGRFWAVGPEHRHPDVT